MKLYRQKASSFWWVDHTFPNGDRIRQSTKKTDKAVARIFAKDMIRQYEEKERIVARKGSFISEYLDYARPRKAKKTVEGEVRVWNEFTQFVGSDNPIDFTFQVTEKFFTHLMQRKSQRGTERTISSAYVNSYHRVLKMMINKAIRWKYALENPLTSIEPVRFEPSVPRFLSHKEITAFMKQTQVLYPHLLPAMQLLLLTGLRRSELFRLEWTDVDFDKKYLIIRKTKSKRPRFVPITPAAEKILRRLRSQERPFTGNLDGVSNMVKKIAVAAGVPDVSLHDLRRSFATHLAPHINKTILQQLMGHEDYSVTDVFYIGSNSEQLRKKMVVLDHLLVQFSNKN